jgi:hypothetical protein
LMHLERKPEECFRGNRFVHEIQTPSLAISQLHSCIFGYYELWDAHLEIGKGVQPLFCNFQYGFLYARSILSFMY